MFNTLEYYRESIAVTMHYLNVSIHLCKCPGRSVYSISAGEGLYLYTCLEYRNEVNCGGSNKLVCLIA